MEVTQIREILAHGENQEVEFRESFHSNQDISKTLCALANTLGGLLFLGVKDNGIVIGIGKGLDKVQQQISNANQAVEPAPTISVEIHKVDGKDIVVVVVQKASDNSYNTFQGAIYVRIGSTTRRLEGQTHLEFLRNRQILSFDESYEPLVKLDDLDEQKIKAYLVLRKQEDFLKEHNIEDFLMSNRFVSKNEGLKIKNSAVLLFGKIPTHFFPQIEVKLVQFAGKEPVEIASHKLLQEDVVGSIEQSLAFVNSRISKEIRITGNAKREERYEYPLNVIREAIVNAVAHRDYFSRDAVQIYIFDDRIEITNPGALPQGLPRELFGTLSVQRNPVTYRFLRDMGYVEGLGTGIPRMKNELRKAGLSDPEFKFTETFFRVILYNRKSHRKPIEGVKDLNDRQKQALEYLRKNKSLKARTYTEMNGVSNATAVKEINEMVQFGYLKKVGTYRGAYYVLNEKK